MVYEESKKYAWVRPKRINARRTFKKGGRRIIGSMQMFFYDPKYKDTLPYYDKFPLAIILKLQKVVFLD